MDYKEFKVTGAGVLKVSESAEWECGQDKGFSLGFYFGKDKQGWQFLGSGVLPIAEAIKLAHLILENAPKDQ
ncbi:hypothetical protein [Rufibacter roseus]|uniref:Uncharacterized protein n=1 Tax=Rufibacter roseus TaxID=1567108 RepID=A0ABW2DN14_9BACT|nr:hypothetical protein [Rufibacter roseus]